MCNQIKIKNCEKRNNFVKIRVQNHLKFVYEKVCNSKGALKTC